MFIFALCLFALCLDYRAQIVVLLAWAVVLPGIVLVFVLFVLKLGAAVPPLPDVAAGPLLQVGQLCAFDVPLEKGNDRTWLPPTHVGQ